ncbi:MAG: Na(+)-translocating NADH-quinone reductase subunit C [Leptospira sp.]|nr:Na(+)-translocating NADH-quinone reductase subunit C [Leptospira sp.]
MSGNKAIDKDSISNVFRVVIGVSLVCSIMVATSAVLLRERQLANQALDLKKNVLVAAGKYKNGMQSEEIEDAFRLIKPIVVDFEKNTITTEIDPVTYDMAKAAKDPDTSVAIPANEDIANLRRLPHYGIIYLYMLDGKIEKIILPISGLGLWSTLYGFISLENDGVTVSGINFYEHSETPGLGGEVDNTAWQKNWTGKKVYDAEGLPKIEVVKGSVDTSRSGSEHRVDGISGATITARAVGDMVRFWLSDAVYGKILKSITEEGNE